MNNAIAHGLPNLFSFKVFPFPTSTTSTTRFIICAHFIRHMIHLHQLSLLSLSYFLFSFWRIRIILSSFLDWNFVGLNSDDHIMTIIAIIIEPHSQIKPPLSWSLSIFRWVLLILARRNNSEQTEQSSSGYWDRENKTRQHLISHFLWHKKSNFAYYTIQTHY